MMVLRMAAKLLGYKLGKGAGVNSHTLGGGWLCPRRNWRIGGKSEGQRRCRLTNCTNGIATLCASWYKVRKAVNLLKIKWQRSKFLLQQSRQLTE